MIVPIFGSPGSGKTTLGNALQEKFGYPFFELSWMPEFRTLNGRAISYEQEEKIAVCALINVAKTYCEHGHRIVLISDFRLNSIDLIMSTIGSNSPVIKLIASDRSRLRSRVLNPTRPSNYRNDNEAIDINRQIMIRTFNNELLIDVTKFRLENSIASVAKFIMSNN